MKAEITAITFTAVLKQREQTPGVIQEQPPSQACSVVQPQPTHVSVFMRLRLVVSVTVVALWRLANVAGTNWPERALRLLVIFNLQDRRLWPAVARH